jgi:hypothetical protein
MQARLPSAAPYGRIEVVAARGIGSLPFMTIQNISCPVEGGPAEFIERGIAISSPASLPDAHISELAPKLLSSCPVKMGIHRATRWIPAFAGKAVNRLKIK